ncbi:hypothetical protein FS749_013922 [Ceratobasidium sp. UAMH 11750]|nr:hypothetical protein FS749_013922 [Ceratobasidium sp. UAMH 11750]
MDQEYYATQPNQARYQNPRQNPLTPNTIQQGWEVFDSKPYSTDGVPCAAISRPILRRQNATVNIPIEDGWQMGSGQSTYSFVSLSGAGGSGTTALSQDDSGYPWQGRRNMVCNGASLPPPRQIKSPNDLAPLMSESNAVAQVMISSTMSISDITRHLVDHRCKDVTQYLDLSSCDETPISWGGFGDIYRGRLSDGAQVAIKCARYSIGSHAESRKILKRSAHELYVWSKYQHPNLLELFGFAQFRGRIAMVSPWMENGNLSQYVSRNPGVDRCRLCVQVCEGLTYLHSMDTVHGDLKAVGNTHTLGFFVTLSPAVIGKCSGVKRRRCQNYRLWQYTVTGVHFMFCADVKRS